MSSIAARGRSLSGVLGLALLTLACGGGPREDSLPPTAVYDVRGIVRQVQTVAGSTRLSIHHEAIPHFVSINGEVESMQAMTMPFPVDAAVDVAGVAAGDKIRFELTVDWAAHEPARITRIEVLPEETVLNLSTPR